MSTRFPRPSILEQIPRDRHAVIEASAGTGKTFTIEHLVVEILLSGPTTIDQILVLTFTEKATQELRRRIRAMLAKILAGAAEPAAGPAWTIDDAARRKLEDALLAFDTASIHTIHGFFQRVLTSNAFAIGRPLEQEMVEGRASFHRAFRTVVRGEASVDPALRRHLSAWLEGAGRGLDALEELAYQCLPHHRRGTPFHPAWRPDALAALCADGPPPALDVDGLKAATKKLHPGSAKSLAGHLAKAHAALDRYRADADALALLAALGETIKITDDSGTLVDVLHLRLSKIAWGAPVMDRWVDLLARLQGVLVSVESAIVQALLPALARQLDRDRATLGQFDFDDMIRLVSEALSGPGAAALTESLRARYRYALVDEFQDTDDVQWSIFERLFFQGTPHVCYLVGDPKQAIYGFRGADVRAYLGATRVVEELYHQPPIPLEQSFRSTPALVETLNRIFRQDDPEPFFTDPEIQYARPVKPGKPDLVLTDGAGAAAAPIVVLEVEPAENIKVGALRRALADAMAADIAALLAPEPARGLWLGPAGRTARVRPSGVFVLTAKASEGRLMGEALRARGVPHAFYKQDGLFQTPEASDLRDLLLAIEDPADRSRRFKAWVSLFFDVPLAALPALAELPHQHALVARLEEWSELARRREHERLFTAITEDSGLVRRLLEAGDERALTNILHLCEILLAQAQGGARLPELIVELSAYIAGERTPPGEDGDVQRLESDRAAVQIMTMHKSKGLEADVVYLFGGFSQGAARGAAPIVYARDGRRVVHLGRDADARAARDLESGRENERLLYVALTRARGRVVLPLLPAGAVRGLENTPYGAVNRRLVALQADPPPGLAVRSIPLHGAPAPAPAPPAADALAWPPEPDTAALHQELAALKNAHRPLEMTSYSRIKRAHGGYVSPLDADGFKGDVVPAAPLVTQVEPDAVPGGVAMGILIHEVLEVVPLDTVIAIDDADAWARDARVKEALEATLARHGVDQALRPAIARLTHRTLRSPVDLGGARLPALAAVSKSARELEFVFPYPERGFVQGVIDLVFEHDGRHYFADWKTDILPDYGDAAVRAHVARNYQLQAQLYALATVKLLGIRDADAYAARFGGLLYCFVRGMRPVPDGASPGVYFERPAWDALEAFRQTLDAGGELA